MDKVECEILGLSNSPSTGGAYALLLKEVYGPRRLPIIIGQFEAQAIALELEGIKPPRPLTHDLLKNLVDNLGATVQEIIITELKENTFYAKIILDVSSLTNDVDARPSDAIALAIRAGAPIFVEENVMQTAAFTPNPDSKDYEEREESDETEQDQDEEAREEKPVPKTKEAKIAALQDKLREAIEDEDYERAAKIRDEIKRLSGMNN